MVKNNPSSSPVPTIDDGMDNDDLPLLLTTETSTNGTGYFFFCLLFNLNIMRAERTPVAQQRVMKSDGLNWNWKCWRECQLGHKQLKKYWLRFLISQLITFLINFRKMTFHWMMTI